MATMTRLRTLTALAFTAAMLAACTVAPERVPPRTVVPSDATPARALSSPQVEATTKSYRIAPMESSLRILVYRGAPWRDWGTTM